MENLLRSREPKNIDHSINRHHLSIDITLSEMIRVLLDMIDTSLQRQSPALKSSLSEYLLSKLCCQATLQYLHVVILLEFINTVSQFIYFINTDPCSHKERGSNRQFSKIFSNNPPVDINSYYLYISLHKIELIKR